MDHIACQGSEVAGGLGEFLFSCAVLKWSQQSGDQCPSDRCRGSICRQKEDEAREGELLRNAQAQENARIELYLVRCDDEIVKAIKADLATDMINTPTS